MIKNNKITIDCPASLIEAGYKESIIAEAISGLCETEVDWLDKTCQSIYHTKLMRGEIKKEEKQIICSSIDSVEIKITVTSIGYQVDYSRGNNHFMTARDFSISKKPEMIGDLLSDTNNNILDTFSGNTDKEPE